MVLALLLLILSIKVVREYQRIVLFRLGRMVGVRGPASSSHPVRRPADLRRPAGVLPRDPAPDRRSRRTTPRSRSTSSRSSRSSIPTTSVVQVANFAARRRTSPRPPCGRSSATSRSTTCSRNVTRSTRCCATKLDEVTERWGVKVTNVEIREIIPPPAVQDAMTRQMSAERTRRALVTEAEGDKAGGHPARRGRASRPTSWKPRVIVRRRHFEQRVSPSRCAPSSRRPARSTARP